MNPSNAQRAATRRNNQEDEKLPLFANPLPKTTTGADLEHLAFPPPSAAEAATERSQAQEKDFDALTERELCTLTILGQQETDLTVDEFYESFGDGIEPEDLLKTFLTLHERGLAVDGVPRVCAVTGCHSRPYRMSELGKQFLEILEDVWLTEAKPVRAAKQTPTAWKLPGF